MKGNDVISIDGLNIHFIDVVRGLKSEAGRVFRAVDKVEPETIAMSISNGEIDGLRDYVKEPFEVEMSRYEELYASRLSKFGDVFLPPPCFLAGLEAAEKGQLELIGIDMDDETHSAAYCAHVSGRDLFLHSIRLNFIKMKNFKAGSPRDFAIKWDRAVNNLRGFRLLETERERFMTDELKGLLKSKKRILAIIDAERADNVRKFLLRELRK